MKKSLLFLLIFVSGQVFASSRSEQNISQLQKKRILLVSQIERIDQRLFELGVANTYTDEAKIIISIRGFYYVGTPVTLFGTISGDDSEANLKIELLHNGEVVAETYTDYSEDGRNVEFNSRREFYIGAGHNLNKGFTVRATNSLGQAKVVSIRCTDRGTDRCGE